MKFFILILLSFSSTVFATTSRGLSAIRHAHESYQEARERQLFLRTFDPYWTESETLDPEVSRSASPYDARIPLAQLKMKDIPDVGSYADLEREFQYIRDTRFMESDYTTIPRRPTWLYPDDGCYARAEVSRLQLEKTSLRCSKKIICFWRSCGLDKKHFFWRGGMVVPRCFSISSR